MTGRRVYPRFSPLASAAGQIRVSREIAVQAGRNDGEIVVLSDTPMATGKVLTLALVSSTGETELRVRVVDSRPHCANGLVRHRLYLEILPTDSGPSETERPA